MSAEKHAVDIVVNAQDNASKTLGGILGSLGGSAVKFGALAKVGSMATQTLVNGMNNFAKSSVQTGMDFSAAMSEVGAISGASSKDMQVLTATAREMGASTQFSATEAADGLKYMAMAGWDTQQMVSGLPGILDLAAASGESLGTTSDIVTDALTAFGMQASDSGHFADVLAMASNKANTNVSMLGESFKYVAPVAGALGYSAEDTSIALGLMANSGIKASAAGTALRTTLTNMANPTDAMKGAMDQLGLSLTNADGSMKSLGEVTTDIQKAFSGLTEEQKAQYAATIAGKEGMSGFLAIANATEKDTNKLRDAIYNCDGAAKDMAATMNDNLAGDITKLQSAWQDLQIELFTAVEPALRQVVQAITSTVIPAISDLLSWLTSLNLGDAFKNFDPKPLIGIATAAGIAIVAIKGFGFLKSFNPFSIFGKRGKTTFTQLGAGLGNLVQKSLKGVGDLVKGVEVGFGQMSSAMMKGFGGMMKTLSTINPAGLLSIAGVVAIVVAAFLALAACQDIVLPFMQGLADIITGLLNGALQALANMLVTLAPILVTLGQALAATAPFIEALGTAIATVASGIGEAVSMIVTAVTPIVEIVGNVFVQLVQIVANAIVQIVQALAPFMPSINEIVQGVSQAIQAICNSFNTLISNIAPILAQVTSLVQQFGDSISQVLDATGGVIEDFGNAVSSVLDSVAGIFDSIGNAAVNAGKGFNLLADGIGKLVAMPLGDLSGTLLATAGGLSAIALAVGGLGNSGTQISALANGLTMIANNIQGINAAAQLLPQIIAQFQSLTNLSGPLTTASASLTAFASSVVSASASMMAAGVGFTMLSVMAMQAVAGLSTLGNAGAIVSSAMATISSSTTMASGATAAFASSVGTSFASVGSQASSMISRIQSSMSAMTSAFTAGVSRAKTTLNQLGTAMTKMASKASTAGSATGRNYTNGLSSGLSGAVGVARSMTGSILSALRSASSGAYSIGYNIGAGLANGMAASLGRVTSVAAQLANAAAKATAAAAKVHSPSRVFADIGRFFGKGLAVGIDKTQGLVEKASEALVAIPAMVQGRMNDFAFAGHTYFSGAVNQSFQVPEEQKVIIVQMDVNGREFAKATYSDYQEVNDQTTKFRNRMKGEK